MHPFIYHMKLRPFVIYFLTKVIDHYEVYYYTAGTKQYGIEALMVLQMEFDI